METGEGAWLNRPASEVGVGVDYKVSEVEDEEDYEESEDVGEDYKESEVEDGEDYEEFKDKEDSNKQFEGA